ncbi:hypothetical protein ACVGVM_25055 [Pseudonocardia bannensis]|uniref:EamA-like transporter family protein n=1 Tax=Pseudonocardia bannensis TaxID=630973 RepID=A0A848DD72_9PSEU|nr:hypothetical protein [Pseudonocardia bannensis]NMH90533.1 hypothetical protein [Pseudonocardia bannensis]
MAFLFRAIGTGPMSVVVPVSALAGAALPVLVALLALGDRPTPAAPAGIAVALPAIWLVSRPHETSHDGSEGGITSRHRRSVAGIAAASPASAMH